MTTNALKRTPPQRHPKHGHVVTEAGDAFRNPDDFKIAQLRRFALENDELKALTASQQQTIQDQQAELADQRAQLDQMRSTLTDALQAQYTAEDNAREAQEELAAFKAGTFMLSPKEAQRLSEENEHLRRRVRDLERAYRHHGSLQKGAKLLAGQLEGIHKGMKRRIAELEPENLQLKTQVETLEATIAKLGDQDHGRHQVVQALQQTVQKQEEELLKLRENLIRLEERLRNRQAQVASIRNNRDQWRDKAQEAEDRVAELERYIRNTLETERDEVTRAFAKVAEGVRRSVRNRK